MLNIILTIMVVIVYLVFAFMLGRVVELKKQLKPRTEEYKEFYCGSDTRAEFLKDSLSTLGTECEIYTIDGEYWGRVKI